MILFQIRAYMYGVKIEGLSIRTALLHLNAIYVLLMQVSHSRH